MWPNLAGSERGRWIGCSSQSKICYHLTKNPVFVDYFRMVFICQAWICDGMILTLNRPPVDGYLRAGEFCDCRPPSRGSTRHKHVAKHTNYLHWVSYPASRLSPVAVDRVSPTRIYWDIHVCRWLFDRRPCWWPHVACCHRLRADGSCRSRSNDTGFSIRI